MSTPADHTMRASHSSSVPAAGETITTGAVLRFLESVKGRG